MTNKKLLFILTDRIDDHQWRGAAKIFGYTGYYTNKNLHLQLFNTCWPYVKKSFGAKMSKNLVKN